MFFRTLNLESLKRSLTEISVNRSTWETHYKNPDTGDIWIEYLPLKHDRTLPQFRADKIPTEIQELIKQCLLSSSEEDWEGVGRHLSGINSLQEVVEALQSIRGSYEVHPRAIEIFRRHYIPPQDPVAHRTLILKLDQLTDLHSGPSPSESA